MKFSSIKQLNFCKYNLIKVYTHLSDLVQNLFLPLINIFVKSSFHDHFCKSQVLELKDSPTLESLIAEIFPRKSPEISTPT